MCDKQAESYAGTLSRGAQQKSGEDKSNGKRKRAKNEPQENTSHIHTVHAAATVEPSSATGGKRKRTQLTDTMCEVAPIVQKKQAQEQIVQKKQSQEQMVQKKQSQEQEVEPSPQKKAKVGRPPGSTTTKSPKVTLEYVHGEFVDVKVDGKYYAAVIIKRIVQKQQRFCKCVVEWLDPANYP